MYFKVDWWLSRDPLSPKMKLNLVGWIIGDAPPGMDASMVAAKL